MQVINVIGMPSSQPQVGDAGHTYSGGFSAPAPQSAPVVTVAEASVASVAPDPQPEEVATLEPVVESEN